MEFAWKLFSSTLNILPERLLRRLASFPPSALYARNQHNIHFSWNLRIIQTQGCHQKMWHNFSQMRSRARRFNFLARNYLRWREKNVIRNSRQHDDAIAAALARHCEWMKWSESIKNVLNEIQPSINNVTSRQFYDPRIFVFSHFLTFFFIHSTLCWVEKFEFRIVQNELRAFSPLSAKLDFHHQIRELIYGIHQWIFRQFFFNYIIMFPSALRSQRIPARKEIRNSQWETFDFHLECWSECSPVVKLISSHSVYVQNLRHTNKPWERENSIKTWQKKNG